MMRRIIPYLFFVVWGSTLQAGYDEPDRIIGPGEYIYAILEWTNGLLVVNGGGGDQISVKNDARLEVLSTSTPLELDVGGIQYISLAKTSHLDYSGGETFGLTLGNNATATLSGGRIDVMQSLQLSGITKHITMICDVDSVNYNAATRLLTGDWLDGKGSFSITLVNIAPFDPTYSNINFIPEPATLLLLASGSLLIRCKVL